MQPRECLLIVATCSIVLCFLDITNLSWTLKKYIFAILLIGAVICGTNIFPQSADAENYRAFYWLNASNEFIFEYSTDDSFIDWGYMWLHTFVKSLGGNFIMTYILTCLIALLLYYKSFVEYTTYIFVGWFTLFSRYFEAQNIVQIRQGLGTALMLYSVKFIYKRDVKKFLICIGMATLIHRAMIIGIILYPMSLIKWNLRRYVFAILLSIGLYLYPITDLVFLKLAPMLGIGTFKFDTYQGYSFFSEEYDSTRFFIKYMYMLICSVFLYKFIDVKYNKIFFSMLIAGLEIFCAFKDFAVLSGRLSTSFCIASSFAAEWFIKYEKTYWGKILRLGLVLVFTSIIFYFDYNSR